MMSNLSYFINFFKFREKLVACSKRKLKEKQLNNSNYPGNIIFR